MVVAAVLLRSNPMSFRSLLVMFGSFLMHIFRHGVSFLFLGNRGTEPQRLACEWIDDKRCAHLCDKGSHKPVMEQKCGSDPDGISL
jgi:hypothetical protein